MSHSSRSQVDYTHKKVQHPNHKRPDFDRRDKDDPQLYVAKGIRYELRRIATALEELREIASDADKHTK